MKNYTLSEEALNAIKTFVQDIPTRYGLPLLQFLEQHVLEQHVKEEEVKQETTPKKK